MKLACKVHGKSAMIVGYAQAKRCKVMAIVVCEGALRAVRLKDITLLNVPEELQAEDKVVKMPERRPAS